jgi:hypothetical protein
VQHSQHATDANKPVRLKPRDQKSCGFNFHTKHLKLGPKASLKAEDAFSNTLVTKKKGLLPSLFWRNFSIENLGDIIPKKLAKLVEYTLGKKKSKKFPILL